VRINFILQLVRPPSPLGYGPGLLAVIQLHFTFCRNLARFHPVTPDITMLNFFYFFHVVAQLAIGEGMIWAVGSGRAFWCNSQLKICKFVTV